MNGKMGGRREYEPMSPMRTTLMTYNEKGGGSVGPGQWMVVVMVRNGKLILIICLVLCCLTFTSGTDYVIDEAVCAL